MRTTRTGLWTASLIACGLFLAEDPAVIAVRQQLRRTNPGALGVVAIDAVLAVVMFAYNYLAVRYVVRVSSSEVVERALAELGAEQQVSRRRARVVRALNPFNVIKVLAERAGGALDRAGAAARRSGRSTAGALLGDLAVVNLLGVPGAGMQRAATGTRVTPDGAVRLSMLFVTSWFAGAWAIEMVLDRVAELPVLGPTIGAAWHAIGYAYGALTDVRTPLGAITVATFIAAVLHAVRRVERRALALATAPE